LPLHHTTLLLHTSQQQYCHLPPQTAQQLLAGLLALWCLWHFLLQLLLAAVGTAAAPAAVVQLEDGYLHCPVHLC
jgi:hypothetical protein